LVVAASAIAFALLTLMGRLVVGPIGPTVVSWTPLQLFRTYFLLDVLTYSAFVGTLYAFHFYRHAESRELAASQLQASLAQARLKMLQAQLEPHFLFNTLNAISVLALEGNHRAVVDTVGRLSELLRVSLSHERPQEVSLARELELVEGYLGIQRVRFADQLIVTYDVAADVLDGLLPSMILQPLVENSIKHGLSQKLGEGRITIRSTREGGHAIIDVIDNGVGIPTIEADRVKGTGIGLRNVNERLRVIYGANYQLQLDSVAGEGTCARIIVPELAEPARITA
jgi:sensor histidine kinase YesM